MFKKLFAMFVLTFCLFLVTAPAATVMHAATGKTTTPSTSTATSDSVIDSELTEKGKVYNPQDTNAKKINGPLKTVVQVVGGVGGTLFTLAVMFTAIMIIFGSLSPQKSGIYWKALMGCAAGAFVFFGAATFADMIAGMAS